MKNQFFRINSFVSRTSALALLATLIPAISHAAPVVTGAPFTQANITDLAGDVTIAPAANPTAKAPAKLQDTFKAPDTLETGRKSRVQLTSADGTIARVGSNTAFSLEPSSRTIHLQQGSILFNSPKGIGGGTIETKSATATVLGTTIIVSATPDGGFKLLVLEGTATMKLPNGQTVTLTAGQMTFVLPASKGGGVGPVLNFDLKKEIASSALVNGFTLSLPSQNLILDATNLQQGKIASGELGQTGQVVVGAVSPDQVVLVDSTTFDNVNNVNNPPTTSATADLVLGPTDGLPLPAANTFVSPGKTYSAAQLGLPSGVIKNDAATLTGLIGNNVSASGNVDLSALDGVINLGILAQNTFTFKNIVANVTNDGGNDGGGNDGGGNDGGGNDGGGGISNNVTFSPSFAPLNSDSGTINFNGLAGTLELDLVALKGFVIPDFLDISANFNPVAFPEAPTIEPLIATPQVTNSSNFSTHFELTSVQTDLQIGNVGIFNDTGGIELQSIVGDVYLNGTFVSADDFNEERSSSGNATIISKLGEVDLYDAIINVGSFANINISALKDVNISSGFSGTTLTTGFNSQYDGNLTVTAGGNINVVNSSLLSRTQVLLAGGLLSISNATLNGTTFGNVTFAGDTINLNQFNFQNKSNVTLYSQTGVLNTNGTSIPGDINFISNVTYNTVDPTSKIGMQIKLGVTADNAAVHAATLTDVTLNANTTPPGGQIFTNVLFRPSDLGEIVGDTSYQIINGLISNHLNASGNVDLTGIVLPQTNVVDLGAHSISISGVTNFNVSGNFGTLRLLADNSFTLAPNSTLGATFSGTGSLVLESVHGFNFAQASLAVGNVDLQLNSSEGDIVFNQVTASISGVENYIQMATSGDSSNLTLNQSSLNASGDFDGIYLDADNLSVTSSNLSSNYIDLYGSSVGVTVESSSLSAPNGSIYMNSNADISIANSTLTGNTSSSNSYPNVDMTAAHVVSVVNSTITTSYLSMNAGVALNVDTVNINSATGVNMSARTINLSNINFPGGSQVYLNSQNGVLAPMPNTNAASVVGDVNFIKNVNYNHTPAQNFVPTSVGGTSTSGNEPIHINTLVR